MKTARLIPIAVAFLLGSQLCQAQWRTQIIHLHPGWNAVHLEVQPQPDDCDTILANLPIESVWMWNRQFSTIQFVKDPSTLVPGDPDWLVWLPLTDKRAFLRRLRSLDANESYLIKVADDAGPVTLTIKGQVVLPSLDWYPHELNLVGFPVNPVNPPTFADFFKFTPEVNTSLGYGNQLFSLDSLGHGQRIVQPFLQQVEPGVAYWVRTEEKPASISALQVTAGSGALDFGATLLDQDLEIQNTLTNEPMGVTVRLSSSETPPANSGMPELAGRILLSYLSQGTNGSWDWHDFPTGGLTSTLAPGETWTLPLGLRRKDLVQYVPHGTNGATYQGILDISDAAQSLLISVPVTATTPEILGESGSSGVATNLPAFNSEEGLWVGAATLDQVNAPAYTGTNVISTPAPMPLRLILHVDSTGQARLLQEVLLVWDPTLDQEPHTNGTYALYASEQALPASATDVKRISSVGFPVMTPVPMSGSLTNELDGTVEIGFGNPVNPFLERYNPMHDNKDWDYVPYTNAVEVPNITREISMKFTTDTNAAADPIWGVDEVGGTYSETLLGLRAQPIIMKGDFDLQRVSRIEQLQGITQ